MMVFMVILSIVAVAAVLLGLLATLKAAEVSQTLQKFKKQQEEEIRELQQRVESLSKSLSGKENPFAAAPSKPASAERKTAPASQAKASPPRPPPPAPAPPAPATAPPSQPVVLDEPEKDVNFDCPHCGQNIDAPASMAGFHVNCPTCSGLITIPEVSTSTRPAPQAQPTESGAAPDDEEQILKGATVRIDIGKMFEELDSKPKRQIVIKRRR